MLSMEGRPKRQSAVDKDYRERKRIRKEKEHQHLKEKDNESQLPPEVVQTHCRQLYRYVKEYPDPDEPEYLLSTLFLQLPSKRQYPDYYEVIKNPIALSNIKSKIDQQEYNTVSELKNDIELMVSNAKKYNIKESQVYQDAVKIHKLVKHWRSDDESDGSSPNLSRKGSLKDKTPTTSSASASASPSTNGTKGKTVLKLPGGAFGIRQQQQPQSQPQPQPAPQQQHVKAIRLKAVDKQSKKRTVPLPELMEAIYRADQKKTLELLETDPTIDVNEMVETEMYGDKFTWGPLHAACYYGDVKVCQALINMGANIELNDTWYSATPLGWAAFGDKDKVARFLVEKYNANRKAKNIHKQVPFDVVNNKDDPCWIGIFKGPFTAKQNEKIGSEDKTDEQSQQSKESQSPVTTTTIPSTESPQLILGKKRRGRPPKSEKEEVRPVEEIDLHDFNPVEFMKDIFHSVRVHTDNSGRLYSEIFEDLPDRKEYPDYYNVITEPRSFTIMENNMVHRRYPTLGTWWNDLKLVFENAMEYNEPGSRVFRDAKLLLRLMNRLKDKTFARFGIPEKQEPAVMRLVVSNVPYEADDRRRPPKRAMSKPRSQTEERSTVTPTPEIHHHHHPSITMVAQQLPLPPTQILPPQQQPHHSIPHPAAMAAAVAGGTPMMGQHTPPNMMNGPGGSRSIMTRPFMNGPAPPGVLNILGAISTNSVHPAFPTPDFVTMPPPPASHEMMLNGGEPPMMLNGQRPTQMDEEYSPSPAFFDLFNADIHEVRPLKAIRLETPDKVFNTTLDGHVVGHSLTVSSKVDVMTIKPVLEQALLPEQRRISIAVLQNNGRLNMSHTNTTSIDGVPSWQSTPLLRGLNTIKITVTANLTRAPNMMPDYRTQIYYLFITQTW